MNENLRLIHVLKSINRHEQNASVPLGTRRHLSSKISYLPWRFRHDMERPRIELENIGLVLLIPDLAPIGRALQFEQKHDAA